MAGTETLAEPVTSANATSAAAPMHHQERAGGMIKWYRSPIPREKLTQLNQRSDLKAAWQTLGFLGIYLITAGSSLYLLHLALTQHWAFALAVLVTVFMHGMVNSFMINAVHELGHGTVFRTKWLNGLFVHVFAFLGWINHRHFTTSHARHHAYTLHPPDDLEVVLPVKLIFNHFLRYGIINWMHMRWVVQENLRLARGQFRGEWEATIFPENARENRGPVMSWSRFLLIGHATLFVASMVLGFTVSYVFLLVPVLVSFSGCYGGWLQWLLNNTQHVGLQDYVPDFRQNCRTFTVHAFPRFLYWQMNYHIEHHMFPTVPCYNLGKLHQEIKHDLPPCAHGIAAVWREILDILKKQEADAAYQHKAAVPNPVPRKAPVTVATA